MARSLADRLSGLRNGSLVILEDNVPTSLFDFIDEFPPPNEIDGPKAPLLRDRDQ
jgi:hypothetical protein